MKKISICVPCFNEQDNIKEMYHAIINQMELCKEYCFEIIFTDNSSTDNSQDILREIAANDVKVKVIINMRNFGPTRSGLNSLSRTSGDAIISIPCDFQEPPEMIPVFIEEWERGNLVVWGQKISSEEKKFMFLVRSLYYKIIQSLSDGNHLYHVTGYGIIDQSIITEVEKYEDISRGIKAHILELGYPIKLIPYKQNKRTKGKSSYSLLRYFDLAINNVCNSSTKPIRYIGILGLLLFMFFTFLTIGLIVYSMFNFIPILLNIALTSLVLVFISLNIFCIGIIGEYLNQVLLRVVKKPIVFEKEKINFDI